MRHGITHRETNLVLQSLRAFISGEYDRLQSALVDPVDWTAFERFADSHSVTPLVAYTVREYGGDFLPPEVQARLQQRLLTAARRNLVLIAEWHRILQVFDQARISVITLKGPALALLAYPNFTLREFTDLDLLVHPHDVLGARDVLFRQRYELRAPVAGGGTRLLRSRNRQLDFANREHGFLVDLHWSALHEMFSFQLPVDRLFESAQIEHHDGISFLSLSPEHMLLYLCAHGTKHCWLDLRWLCDLACHMQTSWNLNWASCIRSAESAKADLVLKHSLLLAQRVLGVTLPPQIAGYCNDAKAHEVALTAESMLFRKNESPGHTQSLRFHLAFETGWPDRARLLFERLFVPEEPDWQQVRLPESLQFLYYTVRPMRLMFSRLRHITGGTT